MKPRTLMTFGMAVMSLTIASGFSPAFSATLTQLVFDEKTLSGYGGEGFLSGTIIYDASKIPSYPDTSGKPIFFEANWKGLVNSLPWQPNNINIKFQTSSVTRFNLDRESASYTLVLLASMFDPELPEFSAFDLRLQYDFLKSGHVPSIFHLETPLGPGSRRLSEGVLELTEVKAVPEPVTIFGSGTALGLGLLASFRRRQSSRSSSLAGVPKRTD
ncbi:PEP-CTERM sorting domain-containing protein [Microcoleus sp. S13C4]|uniref:PEP-CTERM sorting domain-containing protein n=1 Tax=Microcoleus sp. S13C4 TaxID=3055410 RepID=UPI002FD124BB